MVRKVLFGDLNFGIDQGQKVAIVAKTEVETTLLNCLLEKEDYDEGRIVYRNGIRVSFMEQSENLPEESSINEVLLDHDLPELKAIKRYRKALANNDDKALEKSYQELSELNAWDIESKVNQVLDKLELKNSENKIKTLSAVKKRVALAKVILSEADFLI